jgi:hypothetical protein
MSVIICICRLNISSLPLFTDLRASLAKVKNLEEFENIVLSIRDQTEVHILHPQLIDLKFIFETRCR